MTEMKSILRRSPVIPVVTIQADTDAIGLARALLKGGISIIEITLRTDAGLKAIEQISQAEPEICVGAGTVWDRTQARDAVAAGAQFIVSPGISDDVFDSCMASETPILPGAQTVSEIAHWARRGLTAVKFFPAEVAGGIQALKAFAAVFPELEFCPTGGISESSAKDYLGLSCVPCVGGSWLAPSIPVAAAEWSSITALARGAIARLGR